MSTKNCPACGAPLAFDATECQYCGEKLANNAQYQNPPQPQYQQPYQQPQPQYQQPYQQPPYYSQSINKPYKSKIAAGLLAIFLGGFGIHKFYLGKVGVGIVSLIFCWTYIPALIAFVEGIIYLCTSEDDFIRKYVA